MRSLKNHDRAVACILQQLVNTGCLDVHLVFVSKHESGCAGGGGYLGDWYMEEVYETDYQAKDWMRLDGSKPAYAAVSVDAEEILQVWQPSMQTLRHCKSSRSRDCYVCICKHVPGTPQCQQPNQ